MVESSCPVQWMFSSIKNDVAVSPLLLLTLHFRCCCFLPRRRSCSDLIGCVFLAAPYFDLGCKGGDFEGGMKYIIDHGGIALEEEYPYLAEDSKCNHKKAAHRVSSPVFSTLQSFESLQKAKALLRLLQLLAEMLQQIQSH